MAQQRRWLAPDVALVASLVTLFYCLFFFSGYQKLFRDSDAGWHIRTGEWIVAHRALPRSDLYSFTKAGQSWFAWEWGADVLMGLAHRLGLQGVAMMYAVAIAAAVWLWFHLHWIAGGDFLLACAMAGPMLSTTNLHWLARPHILSWIFLLLALLCCERVRNGDAKPAPSLAIIALVTALWANIHASFFLAPALALLYASGIWLQSRVWDDPPEPDKVRWLLQAAAVSACASLMNPYGWNLHRHVYAYLTDSELLGRIGEFQSFDFHAAGAGQILLTLAIAMTGGVAALAHRRPERFLLSVILIGAALRSARALPLAALLLLPLANGSVTQVLRVCRGLRPAIRRHLDAWLAYSARLRRLDAGHCGWVVVPVLVLAILALFHSPGIVAQTGFPPDDFPVAAASEVAKLPADARLLAPDKFGGYLIYRFNGERKVFFDGRSDLYGAQFLKDYGRMMQARPGWERQVASFHFSHALLPNDYSLLAALEAKGWRRLYQDRVATLLEAPSRGDAC